MSEPFESDLPIGIDMETAAIGEVTPEMLDAAVHKAVAATAHQAAIHIARSEDDEPILHPTMESVIADPIRSESHISAAEPEPTASPDVGFSAIECEALRVPPHGDTAETAPLMALTSTAIEPLAAMEEAAAAIAAEATPAEEALVAVQGVMAPPPGLPTSPIVAFERTGETLWRSLPSPGDSIGLMNAQVIEMLASNLAATGQFMSALMGATSVTEVVAVNTDHLRRQMERLTTQGRQLTTLARTIALDAMKPFGPSSPDHLRDR